MTIQTSTSLTGARCTSCDAPFRYASESNIPVDTWAKDLTSVRCPRCGGSKLTIGLSLSLAEDALLRQPKMRLELRAANWLLQGETGTSSTAIHDHMTRRGTARDPQPPADLDDFRRCVLLMHHVPEWLKRMPEMSAHDGWQRLAPAFEAIQRTYLEEQPNLRGFAPRTGAMLAEALVRA